MPSTTHSDLPGLLQRVPDSGLVANIEAREMITSLQLQALRNDEIDLGFARPGDCSTPAETVAAIDDPYCLVLPVSNKLAASKGPLTLNLAAREHFVSFVATRRPTTLTSRLPCAWKPASHTIFAMKPTSS